MGYRVDPAPSASDELSKSCRLAVGNCLMLWSQKFESEGGTQALVPPVFSELGLSSECLDCATILKWF